MKYYFKILLISFFVLNPAFSFEKAFVCCTDGKSEWQWLTDDYENYVNVEGEWKTQYIFIDKNNGYLIYKYFLLKNGIEDVQYMSAKCIKKFGNEYLVPQPANNSLNAWFLFAIDNETLVGGRADFRLTNYPNRGIPSISSVKFIYINDKIILFLSHNDVKKLFIERN